MEKLSLIHRFPSSQALAFTGESFLLKREDSLFLLDSLTMEILAETKDTRFAKKIVSSPDRKSFVLLSGLLRPGAVLSSLPTLDPIRTIQPSPDFFAQDAVYSPDGSYLYILGSLNQKEKPQNLLVTYSFQEDKEKSYPIPSDIVLDRIRYSKDMGALVLFSPSGKALCFHSGKIIEEVKVEPFHRFFFIEKGEILTDIPNGFQLFSHSGKKIKKFPFLIQTPLTAEEAKLYHKEIESEKERKSFSGETLPPLMSEFYMDMTLSREKDLLFYLTSCPFEKGFELYTLSLKDFSLVSAQKGKGKPVSLSYRDPFLVVGTSQELLLYRVKEQNPKE